MALTNDQITAQNFKDFYGQIRPYLNGSAHGGFTPIGTVISVMGKVAPHNYLVCDGTIYNIADYPELAAYFTGQFEASNFFGGDGVTTFAVPDLRGEFLRGSGTNSHTNQGNGATVGVHQNATVHVATPFARSKSDGSVLILGPINESFISGNSDTSYDYYKEINVDKTYGRTKQAVTGKLQVDSSSDDWSGQYAARPTNTSVLYCIATKNIFMDAGCNYSTDEQVVGTWINGKPIYQKTIYLDSMEFDSSWHNVAHNISNIQRIIEFYSIGTAASEDEYYSLNSYRPGMDQGFLLMVTKTNIRYMNNWQNASGRTAYVTVKYTKTTD